ncbi:MAG: Fic family protein [Campylobacterales bacterium]
MRTYQTYIWQNDDWPNFHYDTAEFQELLQRISYQQGLLDGIYKGLSEESLQEIRSETLTLDAVTTSEIEGEILSRDSVRSSVFKKLGIGSENNDRSTVQTDGLVDILLDATSAYDKALTPERLFSWHAALFPTGYSGLDKIRVASYRGEEPMQIVSGPVGREKVHYVAPPRERVEGEMERFFGYVNAAGKENGYIKAALVHLWFVTVHPFDDGNGRIARTITDMLLARHEQRAFRLYSMSAAINDNRKGYYDILEQTTTGGMDVTAWIGWFLETVLEAQKNAQTTIDTVLAKARFWQTHIRTELNARQKKVLNRLLDAGENGFEGGINARKYASLTGCSRVTASRDLSDLVEKGCLIHRGAGGRSTSYDVVWK